MAANLSIYTNSIVKVTLEKNQEVPYVYGNLICYLKYDKNLKMYLLNHPVDEKTGECNAGEAAFDPIDIKFIRPAGESEIMKWAKTYILFHNEIIKEKGSDQCEVDVYELIPNLDLQLK